MELYPLKFKPQFVEKAWGGNRLKTELGKPFDDDKMIGESLEISSLHDYVSVCSNGSLEGNDIQDLIEIFMGDLVGDAVYDKYGLDFPLLVKFIDAQQQVSLQVNPDEDTAKKKHNAYAKTEMWYSMGTRNQSQLMLGFNKDLSKKELTDHFANGTISEVLHRESINKGDVVFIPSGRVHSIGAGNLLCEIHQVSDVSYRISDFDRLDETGKLRELDTDLALDVCELKKVENAKRSPIIKKNKSTLLTKCDHFTANGIELTSSIEKDYFKQDSFVLFVCVEGACVVSTDADTAEIIKKGETILVPASLNNVTLVPKEEGTKLIEVYI